MNDLSNLLNSKSRTKREMFTMIFELYKLAEKNNNIYKTEYEDIPKNLIELYYGEIKPDYNKMIYNFKRKYIENESRVEKNDSKGEKSGISLMYDYIQDFNPKEDQFNIFTTGLILHQLLYKPLDELRKGKIDEEYKKTLELISEAKKNRDLALYRESKAKLEQLSSSFQSFGGKLRDHEVSLHDVEVNVVSAQEAARIYNSFLNPEKIKEYNYMLENDDIILYINYCVRTIAQLIEVQPFNDGNKRTFRGLLNLMFKNRNLPPIYIIAKEREAYKNALIKALEKNDYTDLYHFYYYKICDSIYELDIKPIVDKKESNILQRVKEI